MHRCRVALAGSTITIVIATSLACGRNERAPDVTGQPRSGAAGTTQPTPGVESAAPATDSAPLFRTDSLRYTLQARDGGYVAPVEAVFTNRTGGTVYFVNCKGHTHVVIEKLTDGTWKEAWPTGVHDCVSPPITVAAGRARRFPLHLAVRDIPSGVHPEIDDLPGTYRVRWVQAFSSYQDRPPFGERLPLAQRVSNTFTVLAPAH